MHIFSSGITYLYLRFFFLRNIYAYGNITRLNPTTYTRAKIDLMFESYISFYLCFFLRIALCILHLPLVSLFLSF